ncbi:MAG: hypothetical protein IJ357_04570 [Oscillospiraceae bacterium]|nr:hypothetical protein [Oscillospiraceae bacterium]
MKLDFLRDLTDGLHCSIEEENGTEHAVVTNPFSLNDLELWYNFEQNGKFAVRFAGYCFFAEESDEIITFMQPIMESKLCVIDFYENGDFCFSGDINVTEVVNLTPQALSEAAGCPVEELINLDFKIRSWDGRNDLDGNMDRSCKEMKVRCWQVTYDLRRDKLGELIDFEKTKLTRQRWRINYVIVPIYLGVSALVILTGLILMSIDEVRFQGAFIGLIAFWALLTVALLLTVPRARKNDILWELSHYGLNTEHLKPRTEYEFQIDGHAICFEASGIRIDDTFVWYNHVRLMLHGERYWHNLYLSFVCRLSDDTVLKFRLSGEIIQMIQDLKLPLENHEVLEQLLADPYKVFERIYNKHSL